MALNYNIDEIKKEFMRNGFFSEYLPSNFNLNSNKKDVFSIDIKQKKDYIEPYSYSMSRFSEDGKRRNIHIPELTSYITTVKYMVDNNIIEDLISISKRSQQSFSPILQPSGELTKHEQVYTMDVTSVLEEDRSSTYLPNIIKKINLAKGAKGILCLDISNFYASIYTHMMPVLKIGLANTREQYIAFKANEQNPIISEDYLKYRNLDIILRTMNVGRSNGILTGTLISQFISEALLSCIDKEIEAHGINFIRYVDDYEVFIYNEHQIEKIQNELVSILAKYHFSFNNEKTKYLDFPYYITRNLENIYDKYLGRDISHSKFMELFNEFFQLEKTGTKGAIRFLVKSIDGRLDIINNIFLFGTYLLDILVNDNRSLVKICELIIKQKDRINYNDNEKKIILEFLINHINSHNHLEAIWLLYLLKNIGVNELSEETSRVIIESDNELLKIILIEEYDIIQNEALKELCIEYAYSWIFLYQLYLRDFITKDEFKQRSKISHNLPFYTALKRNRFSFYKSISSNL